MTTLRSPRSVWRSAPLFAAFILTVAAAYVAKAQDFSPGGHSMQPPADTLTPLVDFNGSDGSYLYAPVAQGRDGNFYTTASEGDSGHGSIVKITPAGQLTPLHSFAANTAEGSSPLAGLLLDTDGNFYGTASGGGPYNGSFGTIFKITPAGVYTDLYSFCALKGCADGDDPTTGLIEGTDGNLYGTTTSGGTGAWAPNGTIFKLTPTTRILTTLYSFCDASGCPNGAYPSKLTEGADGNFYGTTMKGGIDNDPGGDGTFFKITSKGTFTTLYDFCSETNCTDGKYPEGGLIEAADGNFYGTTEGGGAFGNGTVFKITNTGSLTTLYSFCLLAACADGANPVAGLVQATDGNLYGTTVNGGIGNPCGGFSCGTIFEITTDGVFTSLWDFCGANNCTDGPNPRAPLIQSTNGNFYGTTEGGWANSLGSVFRLSSGLGPFVTFVRGAGAVGTTTEILGQGFIGTTAVSFNGIPASFKVFSNTYMTAVVPTGATTGKVMVTTQTGQLSSNVNFIILK